MVSSGGKAAALVRRGSMGRFRSTAVAYSRAVTIVVVVILAPIMFFLSLQSGSTRLPRSSLQRARRNFPLSADEQHRLLSEEKSLAALERIEAMFPKEILDIVKKHSGDNELPEMDSIPFLPSKAENLERLGERRQKSQRAVLEDPLASLQITSVDSLALNELSANGGDTEALKSIQALLKPDPNDPAYKIRRENRIRRREKRLHDLMSDDTNEEDPSLMKPIIRTVNASDGVGTLGLHKYSIWRREDEKIGPDQLIRLMKDQLIMAKAYMAIAQHHGATKFARELKSRIKETEKTLGEATCDTELPSNTLEKMRAMGHLLARARDQHYDCPGMVKKLRAMVFSAEEQNRALRRQSSFLSQLAAKTIPKGIFCLSMRLTVEYSNIPPERREFPGKEKLEDNSYFHYALFSDNVLATAVVVNSTVVHALDSSRHVFHIVTDKLNYAAMRAWFLFNPPKKATVEVQSVDSFKWLNSSYCPVLKQLESASMKEYYFKTGEKEVAAPGATANLKYRNPKYLSMLNHLRFYLPEVYPKLEKVLFLDDDIVVQKDLTALWKVDLNGSVNGAVETCGASFHRFDKYLNFSNPLIANNFDPQACGWAYGMNVFDLVQWKKRDITGIYHKWQTLNEERTLWKLGTLPPGLITFYNLTHPLEKRWHALGLGYNPNLDMDELNMAAVVHYNGNMKPWLEISMAKFKPFWVKYVMFDHPFVQQCNINF